MDTSRRRFLRSSCLLCGAVAGLGLPVVLTGCSPLAVVNTSAKNGFLEVPISRFGDKNVVLVRSFATDFDILLVREGETFRALLMQCSHESQPLTFSGKQINCASHGSAFDLTGAVLQPPAQKALTRYPAEQKGELVQINYRQPS